MERGIKSELRQEMMREFGNVRNEFSNVKNEVGSVKNEVNHMNKTVVNYHFRMTSFWRVNDVILQGDPNQNSLFYRLKLCI